MRSRQPNRWINCMLAVGAAVIIVLIPFHAFLTVWLAQAVGHYTVLRLWKEMLLIPLALGAVWILAKDAKSRRQLLSAKLTWLIFAYLAVQIIWGVAAYLTHQVTAKALGYGWISDCRYLIFFLIMWAIAAHAPRLHDIWPKLVFWPAALVVAVGLLQFFLLPYNFMVHFGYSAATIFPYEDINHNVHYIRIMSTLRGANPLGAYLVAIISLLLAALWHRCRSWWLALLAAGSAIALVLTFSRAAWLGGVLSVVTLVWASLKQRRARRLTLAAAAICIVLAGGLALALRSNTTFQDVFLHTQAHSPITTTSDQKHASALEAGLRQVTHEPLGRGPGTAGPASVYNTGHPGRIAENYFVQIAQETGWPGLALFLAINALAAKALWRRRDQALALGLFAALAGLCVVNLFSHAWADDTLAYFWWGLAGLAIASPIAKQKE